MRSEPVPDVREALEQILNRSFDGPAFEARLAELRDLREHANGSEPEIDRCIIERLAVSKNGIAEAMRMQRRLREVHNRLTAPPLHAAVLIDVAEVGRRRLALVSHAGARRAVSIAAGLDPDALSVGDTVLLGHELNVLLAVAPPPLAIRTGETALFERRLADGRAVVRFRDEELVARLGGALRQATLRRGDAVRWDQATGIAFEAIERSPASHLFLEETPSETFADIGGLDREIARLRSHVELHMRHADIARAYRLKRPGAVLLVGPPGTGKTMIARALANWLATLSADGRSRFMHVKPGGLNSLWFGQSESNLRDTFRAARDAGEANPDVPVLMFWDEIDSIGAARGDTLHRVDDRVLQAFMVELNGLESRGNIIVVAATNRLDALDPALVRAGRLGDLIVQVSRPNRAGARAIVTRYLHADLPLGHAGDPQLERERLLDALIARLYAANGDGVLATCTFRDGRQHDVRARDVMSGARLASIVREACERAALREIAGGPRGIRAEDLAEAAVDELESAARMLTPANARRHLEDLPQNADVVRVDPVVRKSARTHRYLTPEASSRPRLHSSVH